MNAIAVPLPPLTLENVPEEGWVLKPRLSAKESNIKWYWEKCKICVRTQNFTEETNCLVFRSHYSVSLGLSALLLSLICSRLRYFLPQRQKCRA